MLLFFIKEADTCFRPLITNKNQIWKLKRENPEDINSISLNISLNKRLVAYFSYG